MGRWKTRQDRERKRLRKLYGNNVLVDSIKETEKKLCPECLKEGFDSHLQVKCNPDGSPIVVDIQELSIEKEMSDGFFLLKKG